MTLNGFAAGGYLEDSKGMIEWEDPYFLRYVNTLMYQCRLRVGTTEADYPFTFDHLLTGDTGDSSQASLIFPLS